MDEIRGTEQLNRRKPNEKNIIHEHVLAQNTAVKLKTMHISFS